MQTNQLRVKLCNFPLGDQTLGGRASGRGNFKCPAGTHRCRPGQRLGQRGLPNPVHPALPLPTSPGQGAPRPENSLENRPHSAGALGLGSRRSHSPSRSRGTRSAAPQVPQSPETGAQRSPRARAAPRARQHSAEGEEPRCPGAGPRPCRTPAPRPGATHRDRLRSPLTEVKWEKNKHRGALQTAPSLLTLCPAAPLFFPC